MKDACSTAGSYIPVKARGQEVAARREKIGIAGRILLILGAVGTRTIHRVGANLSWLVGERLFRIALGVFVLGYVSRYLHTDRFGSFNYAISLTALFTAVANLGIDGLVVRELVQKPDRSDEILGTAWVLKLCGAILAILMVLGPALLFGSKNAPLRVLLIPPLFFIPQSFEVIDLWFQKNIQSKFTVIAKTCAFILGALVRVLLVQFEAPVWAFCAAIVVEATFYAIGLIIVFLRNGLTPRAWRFRADIASILLRNGWPLILSGILVAVYQRIEQFMVTDWFGTSAMGVYSAAARVSDMWNLLPALILPTLYPLLVQKKVDDEIEYRRRVQTVFDAMTGLGLAVAVAVTLTAKFVIPLIFGPEYLGAIGILMIQAWSAPFAFSGAMRAQYFIMENLTLYHSYAALIGIVTNIACGMYFMPLLGPRGAAAGAAIGYAVSALLTSWLFSRLRPCAGYQTRALFILFRLRSAFAEARRFL